MSPRKALFTSRKKARNDKERRDAKKKNASVVPSSTVKTSIRKKGNARANARAARSNEEKPTSVRSARALMPAESNAEQAAAEQSVPTADSRLQVDAPNGAGASEAEAAGLNAEQPVSVPTSGMQVDAPNVAGASEAEAAGLNAEQPVSVPTSGMEVDASDGAGASEAEAAGLNAQQSDAEEPASMEVDAFGGLPLLRDTGGQCTRTSSSSSTSSIGMLLAKGDRSGPQVHFPSGAAAVDNGSATAVNATPVVPVAVEEGDEDDEDDEDDDAGVDVVVPEAPLAPPVTAGMGGRGKGPMVFAAPPVPPSAETGNVGMALGNGNRQDKDAVVSVKRKTMERMAKREEKYRQTVLGDEYGSMERFYTRGAVNANGGRCSSGWGNTVSKP